MYGSLCTCTCTWSCKQIQPVVRIMNTTQSERVHVHLTVNNVGSVRNTKPTHTQSIHQGFIQNFWWGGKKFVRHCHSVMHEYESMQVFRGGGEGLRLGENYRAPLCMNCALLTPLLFHSMVMYGMSTYMYVEHIHVMSYIYTMYMCAECASICFVCFSTSKAYVLRIVLAWADHRHPLSM